MKNIIDDDLLSPERLATGSTQSVQEDAPSSYVGVKAVLWLPDPEQRHGWREFYIRDQEQKPGSKRYGF